MQGGQVMTMRQLLVASTSILSLAALPCQAGPCTDDIDRTISHLDARLAAKVAAGPTAKQSTKAQLHHQPTPGSKIEAAIELGDLSPETVENVRAALNRARQADKAGDKAACDQALADVHKAIGP
jgi:hypothetical protein